MKTFITIAILSLAMISTSCDQSTQTQNQAYPNYQLVEQYDVPMGYHSKGNEDKVCGEEFQIVERDINGNFWKHWWVDCEYKEWSKHRGYYEVEGEPDHAYYGDFWIYEVKTIRELW